MRNYEVQLPLLSYTVNIDDFVTIKLTLSDCWSFSYNMGGGGVYLTPDP